MRLKSSVSSVSDREIAVQFLMTTSEINRMLYPRIVLGMMGFIYDLYADLASLIVGTSQQWHLSSLFESWLKGNEHQSFGHDAAQSIAWLRSCSSQPDSI